MNILITGITGSSGSYLAEYVLENHPDVKVLGTTRWHSTSANENIKAIRDRITVKECDLSDLSSIIRTLKDCRPDRIFHLAAHSNVRSCFDTPLSVMDNNIKSTANLLEATRMVCPDALFQMCSTSEVYGDAIKSPMREDHPMRPVNPYSASKLASEAIAYAYHRSWGLKVVITRMFACINPRRNDLFASSFARQVVEIERGERSVLEHGNLDSQRTLMDVRDGMRAYWEALEYCVPGESYNIGGNDTITVREFLELLKKNARVEIKSRPNQALYRPVDVTRQIPDSAKFKAVTGWEPVISLEDSVKFLLKEFRKDA